MSVILAPAFRSFRFTTTIMCCVSSRFAAYHGLDRILLQQTRFFHSNKSLALGLGRFWTKRKKSDHLGPPTTHDNVAFNLPRRVREKVVTAADAVSLVRNGDTIAVTGFVAQGE